MDAVMRSKYCSKFGQLVIQRPEVGDIMTIISVE